MAHRYPLLAVRVDEESFTAIREYAANNVGHTMREIMQDMIVSYLKERGVAVHGKGERANIRLRTGRRPRIPLMDDAVVILDDENDMITAQENAH